LAIHPWQKKQWKSITDRINQNKIPHAMLFHGPQGIGKSDFINSLVARLMCVQPENDLACGKCDACHLLSVNNHPDLRVVDCDEGKKNISVDKIRDLIDYTSLTPHSAQYKIAIVKQAELMSISAANSLLKTLEEPPKSALIVLLTHKPEQLLPTILSRCQKLAFNVPSPKEADLWLAHEINDETLRASLLALANGAPLKALDYSQQGLIEQRSVQFDTLLNLVKGQLDPVTGAEKWLKLDLELSLQTMLSWIIDLCRLKSGNEMSAITNSDLQLQLSELNHKTNLKELLEYHQFLNECVVWSRSNINTQLLLEDILIRWIKLFR